MFSWANGTSRGRGLFASLDFVGYSIAVGRSRLAESIMLQDVSDVSDEQHTRITKLDRS